MAGVKPKQVRCRTLGSFGQVSVSPPESSRRKRSGLNSRVSVMFPTHGGQVRQQAAMNLATTLLDVLRQRSSTRNSEQLGGGEANAIFSRHLGAPSAAASVADLASRREDENGHEGSVGDDDAIRAEAEALLRRCVGALDESPRGGGATTRCRKSLWVFPPLRGNPRMSRHVSDNEARQSRSRGNHRLPSRYPGRCPPSLPRELRARSGNQEAALELAYLLKSKWEACQSRALPCDREGGAGREGSVPAAVESSSLGEEMVLWFRRAVRRVSGFRRAGVPRVFCATLREVAEGATAGSRPCLPMVHEVTTFILSGAGFRRFDSILRVRHAYRSLPEA